MQTITPTTPLLVNPPALHENLKALQFLPRHCNTRLLLDPTHCPWYPLYPLLGFYLSGTVASDPETARRALYGMDRESHIRLSHPTQDTLDALLPYAHVLIWDSLESYFRLDGPTLAQSIPSALEIRPDTEYFPLPEGITGLRLASDAPWTLEQLDAFLTSMETRWATELPQLRRLSLGGPVPLLRPDFDLPGLLAQLQSFRQHSGLVLELTVGESLFGGAVAALSQDPGYPFPEGAPHLYTGSAQAPEPFLRFQR